MEKDLAGNRIYLRVIYGVSIAVPLLVAFLMLFPGKIAVGEWVEWLPSFHAIINSTSALLLVAALISIKNGKIQLHRTFMFAALLMGVLFLISYVIYHSSTESVKYGDLDHDGIVTELERERAGDSRSIYLLLLASHIFLSIFVVPFVLFAFYFALSGQIEKHKKLVKLTYPIWLYVSVTGVIVYFMIKPYYF